MSEDRIRAKFALAHGRRAPLHECPPLEDIVAWHEKSLDSRQALAMQSHVAHCERCFALWSGMVELEAAVDVQPAERPRKLRWWHFATPALALGVVAVSFWIGLLSGDPLPAYSLDIQGGMEVRGGAEQTLVLRDQTLLRVLLAPATAVDEDVEAVAYGDGPAGLFELPAAIDVTDKGVAYLEAVVGRDVMFEPGTERLLIVVGRRGALPGEQALLRALDGQPQVVRNDWQAFSVAVRSE